MPHIAQDLVKPLCLGFSFQHLPYLQVDLSAIYYPRTVNCQMLLDTGSSISIISANIVNELDLSHQLIPAQNNHSLNLANGHQLPVLGYLPLCMTLHPSDTKREYPLTILKAFAVLSKLPNDHMILGADFILHPCVLNLSGSHITFEFPLAAILRKPSSRAGYFPRPEVSKYDEFLYNNGNLNSNTRRVTCNIFRVTDSCKKPLFYQPDSIPSCSKFRTIVTDTDSY